MPRFAEGIRVHKIHSMNMTLRFFGSVCLKNLLKNIYLYHIHKIIRKYICLAMLNTSFSDSRNGKEWSIWDPDCDGIGPDRSSVLTNFILATLNTQAAIKRIQKRRRPNSHGPPNVYINSSRVVKQRGIWYLDERHLYGHGVSETPPVRK